MKKFNLLVEERLIKLRLLLVWRIMDYMFLIWLLNVAASSCMVEIHAQHEDTPYQDVENICDSCTCVMSKEANKRYNYILSCVSKNFHHILAHWPEEFGTTNNNGMDFVATFSGNPIHLLQQLPGTNASLTFSCRHCGIRDIQTPAFIDVPNLKKLDLGWNEIRDDVLRPEVFRGPFRTTHYEPIGLLELVLCHNKLHTLDNMLFEHTPNLTKLDLSYNKFTTLDGSAAMALNLAVRLEVLNLAHIEINSLPVTMFKNLLNLKELNLSGNEFKTVPENLKLIGKGLEKLSLAGNQIKGLNEKCFLGLKSLRHLNISYNAIQSIENASFLYLENLEYFDCSHNPQLLSFDLDSLLHCHKLTQLDISYCGIQRLSMTVKLPFSIVGMNSSTQLLLLPWPNLRTIEMIDNPWQCDCGLMRVLEYIGAYHKYNSGEARCETPYILAGVHISNLTTDMLCDLQMSKKYQFIEEDPPRFLRKRYIILTACTATIVIVLGLIIGLLVVCMRRRLKSHAFAVEPIRYTSVRSSNLSPFTTVDPIAISPTSPS